MELVKAIFLFVFGIVAITSIAVGLKIIFSDTNEYNRNRRKTGSWRNPLRGTVNTCCEGNGRDHSISAGLAVKNNTWIEQGKLSDEAIDAILA